VKPKIVYINPGDMVEIRVIQDPDLPKNASEWSWQISSQRESLLLTRVGMNRWEYASPMSRFELFQLK
jgi:protein involved in polysaccharide export with SLBB domain